MQGSEPAPVETPREKLSRALNGWIAFIHAAKADEAGHVSVIREVGNTLEFDVSYPTETWTVTVAKKVT